MKRRRFQGIGNIIRFNWPSFALVLLSCVILVVIASYINQALSRAIVLLVSLMLMSTLISLIISFWIYDLSNLYTLDWLPAGSASNKKIVNIHSGFDETSNILVERFPEAELEVLDFYDPRKHTEPSIRRARKASSVYPGTRVIKTSGFQMKLHEPDLVFLIFAAHEIRDQLEREAFFRIIYKQLSNDGRVIVTEHLRDLPNALAYNVGIFHFHSRTTWLKTFQCAGFNVYSQVKVNAFITTFILTKDGNSG